MKSKIAIKMNNDRAAILGLIKEKRNILFGKYSDAVTHQTKIETWADIYRKGCSMGILDPTKGWRYFRDTVWQNWKKRSLKRVINRKPSRTMSSTRSRLDELDKTVLEIVGADVSANESTSKRTYKRSAVLIEPSCTDTGIKELPMVSIPAPSETESQNAYETDSHHTCETVSSIPPTAVSQQDVKPPVTKEEIELKILKTKLELLEREAYMKDIEIYKKEKEVGLPMSKFTEKFYTSSRAESNFYCDELASHCKLEIN